MSILWQTIPFRFGALLYAFMLITSALLILTGHHRVIYQISAALSLPEFIEAGITGILNLGWNEYAYLIGKPTKQVAVFDTLPIVASVCSIATGCALCFRKMIGIRLALLHLVFGTGIAFMSLVVLFRQGGDDTWRLTTTFCFFITNIVWFIYFWKMKR